MLLLWKALLVLCYGKSARGWQSWVSVLAERGPHCSTCPCTAQLHRTLVHSPGTAPREAGTQPGLSCTGIWDAGSWWAETCTKVERSNLDIQDPAGPSLSLAPLEKNQKASVASPPSLAKICRMDTGKKIWEIQQQQRMRKEDMWMLINSWQEPGWSEKLPDDLQQATEAWMWQLIESRVDCLHCT